MVDIGSELEVTLKVQVPGPVQMDFNIEIEASQGVKRSVPVIVDIGQILPEFQIEKAPHKVEVSKGSQKLLFYNVTNIGRATAHGVHFEIPPTHFLSLVSFTGPNFQASGPDIQGGASFSFALKATVPAHWEHSDMSGEFKLVCNETATMIPFVIDVMTTRRNFAVFVRDEASYTGMEMPLLQGATVQLISSRTFTNIKGISDGAGRVLFQNISEGHYDLLVSAEGHKSVQKVVEISSDNTKEMVFLQTIATKEAVRYSDPRV